MFTWPGSTSRCLHLQRRHFLHEPSVVTGFRRAYFQVVCSTSCCGVGEWRAVWRSSPACCLCCSEAHTHTDKQEAHTLHPAADDASPEVGWYHPWGKPSHWGGLCRCEKAHGCRWEKAAGGSLMFLGFFPLSWHGLKWQELKNSICFQSQRLR